MSDLILISERQQNSQEVLLTKIHLNETSFVRQETDTKNYRNLFSVVGKNETVIFISHDEDTKAKMMAIIQAILDELHLKK